MIYEDDGFTCDANKLWKCIINFSQYGENWHSFYSGEKEFEKYLVKKGAAKSKGTKFYKYKNPELENLLLKLTNQLYGHLDPNSIVDVSVTGQGSLIEFYNAKGESFRSMNGICLGVKSCSIIRSVPFYGRQSARVEFLESKIVKYFKACEKTLNKDNKYKLANKCMEFFNKWYDNNGHDISTKTGKEYFAQGTDPDYTIAIKNAKEKGAHWLDGIGSFKIGKTEISTEQIKSLLK